MGCKVRFWKRVAVVLQAIAIIVAPLAGAGVSHAGVHDSSVPGLHSHSTEGAAENTATESHDEIPVGGLFGVDLILAGIDLSPGQDNQKIVICCDFGTGVCSPPALVAGGAAHAFGRDDSLFRSRPAGAISKAARSDIFHPPRLTV